MKRHDRATVCYQRERYIRRRRAQFARWLGDTDWGPFDEDGYRIHHLRGAPRPLDVRQAEFWDGRRMGMLSKSNGTCSCWMCRDRKTCMDRARLKLELWRELRAAR